MTREGHLGQLIGDIVYIELLRRRWSVQVGDISGKEIDFIAKRKGKKFISKLLTFLLQKKQLLENSRPFKLFETTSQSSFFP